MEESSHDIYKRLIRSYIKSFYGNEAYLVINFLLEQEYRIAYYELNRQFGNTDRIRKTIKGLCDDHIIMMSTDDIIKSDLNGTGNDDKFSTNDRGKKFFNFCYYIDYPKLLNIIEYTIYELKDKYAKSLTSKERFYICVNPNCTKRTRRENVHSKEDRKCDSCGQVLDYQACFKFNTNFNEFLSPLEKMIEKTKECEKFPEVLQMTRQQQNRINANRNLSKKSDGNSSSISGLSERHGVDVEMIESKPSDALSSDKDLKTKKDKIPWLTKSYRDILSLKDKERQGKEPISPVDKKRIKLEKPN